MGLTETGTPGNARGVAREAEPAPDTPAFLKNEKRQAHHAGHQEQKTTRTPRQPSRTKNLGTLARPQIL